MLCRIHHNLVTILLVGRAQEKALFFQCPERGARLAGWGAELATGDVTDPASLAAALDGCRQVVHLVAIIRGKPTDFDRVMRQGTADLVAAAKQAGVERFVLMSALGASETTKDLTPYSRGLEAIAEGFRSLGKDDHEINAKEWVVYDALYEFCKKQAGAGGR